MKKGRVCAAFFLWIEEIRWKTYLSEEEEDEEAAGAGLAAGAAFSVEAGVDVFDVDVSLLLDSPEDFGLALP
jgi:hypothetical protein